MAPGGGAGKPVVGCPERSTHEVANQAAATIAKNVADNADCFVGLDEFTDCVYVKNSRGVLVYCNEAHRRFFSPDQTPIGRVNRTYLTPEVAERTEKAYELLLAGCPYVECEHSSPGPDGASYRVIVCKQTLQGLGVPGLAVLGVIRVLEKQEAAPSKTKLNLAEASNRFRELAERDQEICRLTALGVSSRELGERLGMTTRGIELRKQKAFAHLGVAKAVDLARLLVRLQDRGYFDLGL